MILEATRAGLAVRRDPWWANRRIQRRRETGVWVSKEAEKLGAKLDPEVRSWIRNVIVPAMVREYIAVRGIPNSLAEPTGAVPQCKANARLSAEGIQ
jgi:hypothetical protein